MGNFTSRETRQLWENEPFKNIATSLGNFLHHHGEHERLRAAERHLRQQERKSQAQHYHHHHHFDEPFTLAVGPRGGGYHSQQYHEEPPRFEAQRPHTGRRNHDDYDNREFIRPCSLCS